jgi:endonuclease G
MADAVQSLFMSIYMMKDLFRILRVRNVLLVTALVSFTACGSSSDDTDDPGDNTTSQNEWETGGRVIAGRTEIPRLRATSVDQFIDRSSTLNGQKLVTYSMEYNYVKFHARWVAYYFTASNSVQRCWGRNARIRGVGPALSSTLTSPRLTRQIKAISIPIIRVVICVRARTGFYSQDANNQTFYYSNMSPQLYDFNGGIWMYLESKVRTWGYNRSLSDTLFVVKGGTINTEDNIMGYTTTGTHKVAVPKYYFMALLARKGNNYEGIAFMLEHRTDYPSSGFNFSQYAMTIKALQDRTHIDFFPSLPDSTEKRVENVYDPSYWTNLNAD